MSSELPRYIVWSTDHVDLQDPFQRRWLLRQTLLHGRAQDIRALDLEEISRELDKLNLPPDIYDLWKKVLDKHEIYE
jgi:hypothetical protein